MTGTAQRRIRFGVIGCGLMGREFASAAARWCHLPGMDAVPEIIAICRAHPKPDDWFTRHVPSIRQVTPDYRELLANPEVEAAYIAVPHHLHREMYCAAIEAGKHLLGEKPFGMTLADNETILECASRHPQLLVRCSSEYPFFPALQRIGAMIEAHAFGRILEVSAGFLHSSDLDPAKPINWKRMVQYNGEYGCMGDLGMHVCHIPFRAGWTPVNVRAILSNIVTERPDGKGGMAPCSTWDNATLLCQAQTADTREEFPLTLRTQRIAPGNRNTWYLEIMGTAACVRYSTLDPNALQLLEYRGGEQTWQRVEVGHQGVAFASITGAIFEFGFSDAMLQMWAAFLHELAHGKPLGRFAGCVRPEETRLQHLLLTAAVESNRTSETVAVHKSVRPAAGERCGCF